MNDNNKNIERPDAGGGLHEMLCAYLLGEADANETATVEKALEESAELRAERGNEAYQAMKRPRVGIYIENVFDPSPAHAAGIQPGDWLTRFGDAWIGSPLDFQKQLYLAGIGNEVELEFFREYTERTVGELERLL